MNLGTKTSKLASIARPEKCSLCRRPRAMAMPGCALAIPDAIGCAIAGLLLPAARLLMLACGRRPRLRTTVCVRRRRSTASRCRGTAGVELCRGDVCQLLQSVGGPQADCCMLSCQRCSQPLACGGVHGQARPHSALLLREAEHGRHRLWHVRQLPRQCCRAAPALRRGRARGCALMPAHEGESGHQRCNQTSGRRKQS